MSKFISWRMHWFKVCLIFFSKAASAPGIHHQYFFPSSNTRSYLTQEAEMPEKRKTDAEPGVDLLSAKRARQQLSYADLDDSAETGPAPTGGASHEPGHNESYRHESTGHGDDETTGHTHVARKQNSNQRQNNSSNSNTRPRVDPVYGQRSAFPGLDDLGSDQLFYGPAEDGLEYLRMVR
jgi:hypothetical protein